MRTTPRSPVTMPSGPTGDCQMYAGDGLPTEIFVFIIDLDYLRPWQRRGTSGSATVHPAASDELSGGGARLPEDRIDLPDMVQIVAGGHLHHVMDALVATLGVDAVVVPQLAINAFQQHDVALAERTIGGQRLLRVALLIVERL